MLVTLEWLYTQFTGKEVQVTEDGFKQESCPTESACRGTLRRWLPARPHTLFSPLKRVKLAWGVLIGRYDAFSWEIKDEKK